MARWPHFDNGGVSHIGLPGWSRMMTEPEKKIIVDEDWKSRVEAEREAARHETEPSTEPSPSSETGNEPPDVPLPPPTLAGLVTMLMTQAIVALGLVPLEEGRAPRPRLHEAKHLIDMIALLESKTSGACSEDESAMIASTLHELRMSYVAVNERTGSP